MPFMTLDELGRRFAIDGQIAFSLDPGGMPLIDVRNAHATARVALNGGNVVAFQPHGQAPVLFLSERSQFRAGKAIRGGIPICWPWFGPHAGDPAKPQHGFARTMPWSVERVGVLPGGESEVELGLVDSDATRALWPQPFALRLQVVIGAALEVALTARNMADAPITCTAALHSYFAVGDIVRVQVDGLDGREYVDKIDGDRRKVQTGPVTFGAETDRVYLGTDAPVTIVDAALERSIDVQASGSRSTVVWNPWIDKARAMSDFGDDEYRRMLCVETANALDDAVTIAPGGEHRLWTRIAIES
jgi:glucose-6-phosphate 1-epimerase